MGLDRWSVLVELYKAATIECRDSRRIIYEQIAANAYRNSTNHIQAKDIKRSEMALRYRIAVEEEMNAFIQSTFVK